MSTEPADVPDVKIATPDHTIMSVFSERWSPRAFADTPVGRRNLQRILEAARWTMSSYNEQPWRYLLATKDDEAAYEKLFGCLNEYNRKWAKNAPVLMMSFAKTTFSKNEKPNRCAQHDVGAASAALTFQATDLGLYVHQMAGILPDEVHERYDVPDDVEPVAGLAIGYLGEPAILPEKMQNGERTPRTRKSIDDFVFGETWGETSDTISGS